MLARMRGAYQEFPVKFWVLIAATFIDTVGGTLIFPFFALYVTHKFNVGMTEAGVLLAIFSVTGLTGSMVGGALTDKFGRRGIVLFGLVFSALSSLAMGFVNDLSVLYGLAIVVGSLSRVGGPARQAMVADILPEEKQAEGFGVLRVAANLAWIIGPTIGGFLASRSYLLLFVLDAVASVTTALIVYRLVPETRPKGPEGQPQPTLLQTVSGYRLVLADKVYVAFLVTSMLMWIGYQQIFCGTLSVFLRDVHGIPTQAYGLLTSLNAGSVVLLQFWVTRKTRRYRPMLIMAAGAALYVVGLTMYGFVSAYALFVIAMLIITLGELIVTPTGQALAAQLAPEDMRGRYMAIFGLSWTIPATVGPWAAGVILDNYNPNWVWYAAGIASALAAAGFYLLYLERRARAARDAVEKRRVPVRS
jgi:MFS family permease